MCFSKIIALLVQCLKAILIRTTIDTHFIGLVKYMISMTFVCE